MRFLPDCEGKKAGDFNGDHHSDDDDDDDDDDDGLMILVGATTRIAKALLRKMW